MTGDIFILVFSLDDLKSFFQIKQILKMIFELKRSKILPILIIANKLDVLVDKKIQHRCVDLDEIQSLLQVYKSCVYSEISCKNLLGLELAFQKMLAISNLPKGKYLK